MKDYSSKKSQGKPIFKFYESEDEPRFSKLMFLVSAISVFWWLGFSSTLPNKPTYNL
jgi:hypothetical protein